MVRPQQEGTGIIRHFRPWGNIEGCEGLYQGRKTDLELEARGIATASDKGKASLAKGASLC